MDLALGIIVTVLAIIIFRITCRNSIGTTGAYLRRFIIIWMICLFIVGGVVGRIWFYQFIIWRKIKEKRGTIKECLSFK